MAPKAVPTFSASLPKSRGLNVGMKGPTRTTTHPYGEISFMSHFEKLKKVSPESKECNKVEISSGVIFNRK